MTVLLSISSDNTMPMVITAVIAAVVGWFLARYMKGNGSSEWETKYNKLNGELQQERDKNSKLNNQLKKKANASGTTGAASTTDNGEIAKLKSKLESLKQEAVAAQEAKLTMQADVNAANAKAKEANAMSSEIEGLKARIDSLNKALEEARKNADKYKTDFENANGERARLSQQLASSDAGALQKTIDKLESDLNSSRFTAGQLQAEVEKLKNGDRKLFNEGEIKPVDHTETIKQLEDDIKALKTELNAVRFENDRWSKEIANKNLEMVAVRNDAMMKSNAEIIEMRNKLRLAELDNERLKEAAQKQAALLMNTTTYKPATPPPAAPVAEPIVEEHVAEVQELTTETTPVIDENTPQDDLTVLEGVGPVLAKILNDAHIVNYAQLASSSVDQLKQILENAGDHLHNPASWPKQAELLRDGKMDEFKAFCDELTAGRM